MSNASSETINTDLSLSPFPETNSSPTSSPDLSERDSPLLKSSLLRSNESQDEADARQKKMADAVRVILECIGEDPKREGLLKTPDRYAKALLWLTRGYTIHLPAVINEAIFEEDHGEIVLVRDIGIESLCEHHLVPFVGKVSIAYIPNGSVIGLSKLARIAEIFARRLQVQERLTKQIAQALWDALSPKGVAVLMEATHMCMTMRGVQKPGATTATTCMLGCFETVRERREEFFMLTRQSH